jgi:NAD(P)-dependent dehydrogenase (short-subunit alcohol dehydrogenase family)
MGAYARSKLANILFAYELSRRLEGSGVTVNALHPGHVATGMWTMNIPALRPVINWFAGKFALTPDEGADNSIFLASSPDVEGVTGLYFVKREPAESSPLSYDEGIAAQLWETSARLTGLS